MNYPISLFKGLDDAKAIGFEEFDLNGVESWLKDWYRRFSRELSPKV